MACVSAPAPVHAAMMGFSGEERDLRVATGAGDASAGAGDAGAAPAVPDTPSGGQSHFPSPVHRDSFLLFRALYRLSMKQDVDANAPASSVATRSKVCAGFRGLAISCVLALTHCVAPAVVPGVAALSAT